MPLLPAGPLLPEEPNSIITGITRRTSFLNYQKNLKCRYYQRLRYCQKNQNYQNYRYYQKNQFPEPKNLVRFTSGSVIAKKPGYHYYRYYQKNQNYLNYQKNLKTLLKTRPVSLFQRETRRGNLKPGFPEKNQKFFLTPEEPEVPLFSISTRGT
ncbi:MAG: hypothetical protein CM15mP45_16280 [Deltaproteobacteria bacterium]|nr:MAG: hypothetical protein CM15mP45_16280 [Deltaproteobacteria bacterium]